MKRTPLTVASALVYCYAAGPCDTHVAFQCPECLSGNPPHISPAECDACGCLACSDEHVYGTCDHLPELTVRCSNCRCTKCKYRSGTFSAARDKKAAGKEQEAPADAEQESNAAPRKPKTPIAPVTYWRPG